MAKRAVITINEDRCNGCGQCVTACAEGAIQLVNGKARLVSEIYCDGLGACLGECPQNAITMEEREAAQFDEKATEQHLARLKVKTVSHGHGHGHGAGCPGSMTRSLQRDACLDDIEESIPSALGNWPVQITLVSPAAPYFQGADLLLAADCVPFAYADFHRVFLRDKPVLVGCPKLDDAGAYIQKIAQIISMNNLQSITVARMEVPCCSGLMRIVQAAIEESGEDVPLYEAVISIRGELLSDRQPVRS